MASLTESFGERVKKLRLDRGLSQIDLSKLTGLRQATISAIETGTHAPTLNTVELIAKALKSSASSLLPTG